MRGKRFDRYLEICTVIFIKNFQPWCSTKLDKTGRHVRGNWADCGPDCPRHPNAWMTDDTLKLTRQLNQEEMSIGLKLYAIITSSLIIIGLVVTCLGNSLSNININHYSDLAMVITEISERIEDEKEIRLDMAMIKRIILVDFLLLTIFTIIFFTCFGCFFVISTFPVQTVTLSSEGAANKSWPHSLGEFQLAEEVIHSWSGVLRWYRHVDRNDRFIMYRNFGIILT